MNIIRNILGYRPSTTILIRNMYSTKQSVELPEDKIIADAGIPKLSRKRLRNIMLSEKGISKKTAKEQNIGTTKFLDMLIESQSLCRKKFNETFANSPLSLYQYNIQNNEIVNASEPIKQILSMNMASQKEVNRAIKNYVIQYFSAHTKDTGSPEVQIGVLTVKILQILEHLKKYRMDHPSKKLVIQLIQQRNRLLKHLRRNCISRYLEIMSTLKLTWNDVV